MTQWTNSAKAALEVYFAQMRRSLPASGADTEEVIEDLRRHIDAEVTSLKLPVVNEEDIRHILARIGGPEPTGLPPEPNAASAPPTKTARTLPGWLVLLYGVLLPVITLGFEFATGACAGVFFDPLPNVGNVLLVALVPLANLLVWLAVRQSDRRHWVALGWLNGIALGVAVVYALLFLPLTPFAAIGVLVFGVGLIPLTPLLSLIAVLVLRGHLRRAGGEQARLPGLWLGAAAGVAGLVICTLPMILTETGIQMAASGERTKTDRGIQLLRTFGREERLLRLCYGREGRAAGLYAWGKEVYPEEARLIYYRVTGRAFNSVPPPRLYAGRVRWRVLEKEFTWDNDQAGDAVAGRVKGLLLVSSRQDGSIDADAALGYLEWTMEFKNDSALPREARAQIALPLGGVVSRLTLWIDGEEREAAFGGRSQVKTAYKEVVARRHDPVLVTTCGPDRVLMQCFPVPPDGGRMKVRLGVTTPLMLTNAETGFLGWPHFLERNFTVAEEFRHSLWLQCSRPLATAGGKLVTESKADGAQVLRGQVSELDLAAPQSAARVQRDRSTQEAWTKDTIGGDGFIIRQSLKERDVTPPDRVVLVVDASRGMEPFLPAIADAISRLPGTLDFFVLLALDGCQSIPGTPHERPMVLLPRPAADALRNAGCAGGQDNVPALVRAWDLAAQKKDGVVIWIHGPQPVLMENEEELLQRFERQPAHPRLLEIQTRAGPNRVAEKLDGIDAVQSVPRLGGLRDDLERLFGAWRQETTVIELARDRVRPGPLFPALGHETSMPLARLWAADEVGRLRAARKFTEAMQLATRHQLVTPASGAVVLETKEQFARAGLQPADSATVPVIPEPSTWALLGLAVFMCRTRTRILRRRVDR